MQQRLTSKDNPKQRRNVLREEMRKNGLKFAILSNPLSVTYLTGFHVEEYRIDRQRVTSFLLMDDDDRDSLLLGENESESARNAYDGEIRTFKNYDLNERMIAYPDFVAEELGKSLADMSPEEMSRVGIEDWHLPKVYMSKMRYDSTTRFTDLSATIMRMRKTKGRDEISHIIKAVQRLDLAFKLAKPLVQSGHSEMEIFQHISSEFYGRYGPSAIPAGVYQSGPRALDPAGSYIPTSRKLRGGDTIILDLQTSFNNYWADTTRTFVAGSLSHNQRRVFRVLVKAIRKGESMLKPGVKGKDIYYAISSVISESGCSALSHHAGHGMGLEDQEPPFFMPFSNEELEEGTVCALEPGIYCRSTGGVRIEDNYVITKDGFIKLSKFPRRLD